MIPKEFNVIVEARIEKIRNILQKKAAEYATGGDRFHNFKVAAGADTTTVPRALWGMFLKHYVSVKDIVDRFNPDKFDSLPSLALLDEKIGDSINYLILLEGIIIEEINNMNDKKTTMCIGGISNANIAISGCATDVTANNMPINIPTPGWLPKSLEDNNE